MKSSRPSEKELYEMMWEKSAYRLVSPGEYAAVTFLALAQPERGATVLDLGCGTGRGGLALTLLADLKVTLLDFAGNCLDANIRSMVDKNALSFVEADLSRELPVVTEYGFCADVLEHIKPHLVNRVLDNCLNACQKVFFQIATTNDLCGSPVGYQLHLSVHPYKWWLKKFRDRKYIVHWSKDFENNCMFYISPS